MVRPRRFNTQFSKDLAAAGVDGSDPWDLVERRPQLDRAIPVLLRWLDEDAVDERFREGVVRSLALREARQPNVSGRLLREFARPGSSDAYRWAVGNTLGVVVVEGDLPRLVALAGDAQYGRAREMLFKAFERFPGNEVAEAAVVTGLADPEVAVQAAYAAGVLELSAAREPLVRMAAEHERPLARREAAKALKRLS